MKQFRDLIVVLGLVMQLGSTCQAVDEETLPGIPLIQKAVASDDVGLPPIPLSFFLELSSHDYVANKLELTTEQREAMNKRRIAYQTAKAPHQAVMGELQRENLKNYPLFVAATAWQAELDAKTQNEAQDLLTPQQRAKLRQLRRHDIQQASFKRPANAAGIKFIIPATDVCLTNDDLLSVLIQTEIQQQLEITDEQWKVIEATAAKAYPAASELLAQLIRDLPASQIQPSIWTKSNRDQLLSDTLALLTEEQRAQYHKLNENRSDTVITPPAKASTASATLKAPFTIPTAAEIQAMYRQLGPKAHGSPTTIHCSQQGLVTAETVLYNAFRDPEFQAKLQLTETQHQEIDKRLEKCQQEFKQRILEGERANLQYRNAKHQSLRNAVLRYNRIYQKPLQAMLTPEQTARLHSQKWKSLGMSALVRQDVADELKLTKDQQASIFKIFNTPAPPETQTLPVRPASNVASPIPESVRKMVQQHHMLGKRLAEIMTPEQRQQAETMLGVRFEALLKQ